MSSTQSRAIAAAAPPHGPGGEQLLKLYEVMFLLRRFELKAQEIYKKGLWPGFIHLYVGEEAVAAGVCAHLRPDDWITSTHRGHGHALAKGLPPRLLMAELAGRAAGCCGGRGGSMHLYYPPVGLLGTNGIVGGGLAPAVGAGLSARVRGTDQVGVAFFGDGASNHGAFHESLNLAGIQRLPVVFVCENNLYATATPFSMATLNTDVATRAAAYGLPGVEVDGNDVLEVWAAAREAVDRARAGEGPTLIEAKTYRFVGHHEGDPLYGTYRTKEEVESWKTRCPVDRLRARLLADGTAERDLAAIEARVRETIEDAVRYSREGPECDPSTVYDHVYAEPVNPPVPVATQTPQSVEQGWLEAVRDGIAEEMRRQPAIVYLGEGIGERGGSFGHTKGLWHEFGPRRVIDTPISELGFTGAAIGASATGCPAVADMMFSDFLFEAASPIIHQAAKLHYMSNGQVSVPLVIRAAAGAIKNSGAHHSGTYHSMWANVPGLLVVMPSTPADAKGLMKSALRTPNPVIFLEPKGLFASRGEVPVGDDILVPLGRARIVRPGRDLTIATCGLMLHRCLEAAEVLATEKMACEVIDLRSIVPLDMETVAASLARTHRLLVVDEGWAMCGVGAELSALVMEHVFDELDAPVGRLHTGAVVHPFATVLENAVVPTAARIAAAAREVMGGIAPVQRRLRVNAGGPAECAHAAAPTAVASSMPSTTQAKPAIPAADGDQASGEPLCMPHGDLTVEGGTVVRWLKQVGDPVTEGEPVLEVETDKAVVEVESPLGGTLAAILEPAGAKIKFGQPLGTIQP